jgi:hypothetical protein
VRAAAVGVIALVAGVLAATAQPRSTSKESTGRCSDVLPDLKTLSDPRRNLVYFRPQTTTIIAINKRQMPSTTPTLRARGFERHVWRVVAQITDYTRDADGNIRLILFDESAYMVAAMPAPHCLSPATRARQAILDARNLFESRCGKATLGWRKLGAVVHIEGVGMWNIPRGQRGHARNYAELRPVTSIRLIAGCA